MKAYAQQRCIALLGVAMLSSGAAAAQSTASAAPSDDAQRHLSRGILLASQKQYKAAKLELEKADAIRPGDFAILFNLGQVELRSDDSPHAEVALARALKLKPQSPETMYLLAQVYVNESRPLDALDLLVKARDLSPENVDVLYLMAEVGISQRYYEDAIAPLEKAARLAPERTDVASALGEAYFKSDNIDKAIAVFSRLIQSHPTVTAYVYLGLANAYLGRFDEAKKEFQSGLKLEPNNNECLFQLGYIAKVQGDTATAEALFNRVLRANPNHANSLLELGTIRMERKQFVEAVELLRRYTEVSGAVPTGYYKLAMAEKGLHDTSAAQRDLEKFQSLSKDAPVSVHPYDHLYDYIDDRAKLGQAGRVQQDVATLTEQVKLHPDRTELLYELTEAYLKSGEVEQARSTVAAFDTQRPNDVRTLTGLGVLLARYGLFDDAIAQFQAALQAAPKTDDARFDLANAYFHKGSYADALAAAQQVSEPGRKDDAYDALLADIDAHQGDTAQAESLFQGAIERNPDNDQDYLSLALLQLRDNKIEAANETLRRGQARVPGSGKLAWGQGLAALLSGDTATAGKDFERAVELLPEWPGSYATLGFFYYQTGQIDKAKEVLDRFKNSGARGGLDVGRITQTLANAPAASGAETGTLSAAQRGQVFQLAVYLADKTL
jgi:tetratricopeptide (TPR) repeat protein